MWQRLLQMLGNQPAFIERLSETKLMKRAAEITVASYQTFRQQLKTASGVSQPALKNSKESISRDSFDPKDDSFFNNFKSEISKEYDQAKKKGLL